MDRNLYSKMSEAMKNQPEKTKDAIAIYAATRGSGSQLGNFTVDQITQDFVKTEALKFFERLTSETQHAGCS